MANEVKLQDGVAVNMGDDVFIIMQRDYEQGMQNVVLTKDDLRRLLEAEG